MLCVDRRGLQSKGGHRRGVLVVYVGAVQACAHMTSRQHEWTERAKADGQYWAGAMGLARG